MDTYTKYDNKLIEGRKLFCKRRGEVEVVKVESQHFWVKDKNGELQQELHDIGKMLFFSEEDYKLYSYNVKAFPSDMYAPYQEGKNIQDIYEKIANNENEFFDEMSYHDKEKYKEEQHFNKVEDLIKKDLDAVTLELSGSEIINNGNSEAFDPGIYNATSTLIVQKTDLIEKKNNPYFAEVIELGEDGKPVYIGKKAIPGQVVDSRDLKYANILRLKEYQKGKVKLLREFDIVESIFIDFRDRFNSEHDDVVVADPFLLKILEYNRNQQKVVNIAQTIREEQHRVIISPLDENFILEGCAGSGKTIILLHRLSSLVFNEPDLNAENLVIISPNNLLDNESKEIVEDFEIERAQKGSINALYFKWIQDYLHHNLIYDEMWNHKYLNLTENNNLDKDVVSLFYSREFVEEFGQLVKTIFRDYKIKLGGFDFVSYEEQRIRKEEETIFCGMTIKGTNSDIQDYYGEMALSYGNICRTLSRENAKAKLEILKERLEAEKGKLPTVDEEKKEKVDDLYKSAIQNLKEKRTRKEKKLCDLLIKKYSSFNTEKELDEIVLFEKGNLYDELISLTEKEIEKINREINKLQKKYEKELQHLLNHNAYNAVLNEYNALLTFYQSNDLKGDVVKNREGEVSISSNLFKGLNEFYKKYSGKTHASIVKNNGSEGEFWHANYNLFIRKQNYQSFLNGDKSAYLIETIESIISYWKNYSNIDNAVHYEFEIFLILKGLQSLFGEMSSDIRLISLDEYQDCAPAEIEMLGQMFGSAVLNLYGDPNQRINPKTDEEVNRDKYNNYFFRINYRNGKEITEYINNTLGTSMQTIGVDGEVSIIDKSDLLSIPVTGEKRVALIVKSEEEYKCLEYDKSNDNLFWDDKSRIVKDKLNVIPVRLVKGLEFEQVYVYDRELNKNEKYVAYTRALKSLVIIR